MTSSTTISGTRRRPLDWVYDYLATGLDKVQVPGLCVFAAGTAFSITHEHYYPTPEPPLGMATVNLDGGGRLTLQIADENTPLQVGDRVELVFRRLHDAGGRPNYFWKCRALANPEQENAG